MKKKGLLISTIVMVVVLVASLTTATYAWFGVSSQTTIDGFQLQVVSNTAVRIGMRQEIKADTVYNEKDGENLFVNDSMEWTSSAGSLIGSWDSTNIGLGASITPNIAFAGVSSAVGVTGKGQDLAALTDTLVGGFKSDPTNGSHTAFTYESQLFKANSKENGNFGVGSGTLAVVNGNEADGVDGDLAYMWLGIQPAKKLVSGTNKLYIVVQSTGAAVGLGSAVHVAYRHNGANEAGTVGSWEDVDVFGDVHQNQAKTAAELTFGADGDMPEAVKEMIEGDPNFRTGAFTDGKLQGAAVLVIDLNGVDEKSAIDQLELVIYIAGWDSDCVDNAVKNVTVNVGMYFGAQADTSTTQG